MERFAHFRFIVPIIGLMQCLSVACAPSLDRNSRRYPTEMVMGMLQPAISTACSKESTLPTCFPHVLSDCVISLENYVAVCLDEELAKLPPRTPEQQLGQAGQKALMCAIETVFETQTSQMLNTAECRQYVSQVKEKFKTVRASGFSPDSSAKGSTDLIIQGLMRSLASTRCNPEVVSACFRVSEQICLTKFRKFAESCAEEIRSHFQDQVTRHQAGEIGEKLDACIGKFFLPEVVQPNSPTAACSAAMRAHW